MTRLEPGRRLLSCVLPKGVGLPLLRRLADEKGIVTADLHSARGFADAHVSGVFGRVEKDVLTAVVPAARADEIFEWLYHEAEVAGRTGRMLTMARLHGATAFELPPELPREGG